MKYIIKVDRVGIIYLLNVLALTHLGPPWYHFFSNGGNLNLSVYQVCVKQLTVVNIINMFQGKSYNNQERPNLSRGKLLATCVAILGAQTYTVRSIYEILHMSVNINYIRAKNRVAYNYNSH